MQPDVFQRMAEIQDVHWWFVARRHILSAVLDRLELPAGARIIEIGCGTGGNLAMLSRHGSVSALEPDAMARAFARIRGGVDVHEGALPDRVPFEDGAFDLVVALDTIEHIDNDRATLETLLGLLRPGGALVVTVPAYQFLWSRHDEVRQHRRRYLKRTLLDMVRAVGFRPVYSSYFNTWLFPAIAAIRLVRRAFGNGRGDDDTLPPPFLNWLLTKIFSSERYLIGRVPLPMGVSIIVVARRPEEKTV